MVNVQLTIVNVHVGLSLKYVFVNTVCTVHVYMYAWDSKMTKVKHHICNKGTKAYMQRALNLIPFYANDLRNGIIKCQYLYVKLLQTPD